MKKQLKNFKETINNASPIVLTVFVISVVCMNLLANKSINLPVDWLALDCGILVSGITFLSMDILVIKHGAGAAFKVSLFATLANIGMSLIFYLASLIPGMWGETYTFNSMDVNTALDNTFGGTWFILLGSTIAFLTSSGLNGIVNEAIGKLFKEDSKLAYCLRCYVSTILAQFVDNMIFALIVSHNFFGWTILQCLTCSATGALLELFFEVVFSPIGYMVCKEE